MIKNNSKILMIVGVLSIATLIGCSNEEVADVEEVVETSSQKQTEQQLAVRTPQEHYDYVYEHESRVENTLDDFNYELNVQNVDTPILTDEVKSNIDSLRDLVNEYNSFDNPISITEEAGKDYQRAMIKLDEFIDETELAIKEGLWNNNDTGVSELIELMGYSLQAKDKFESVGVDLKIDDDDSEQTEYNK